MEKWQISGKLQTPQIPENAFQAFFQRILIVKKKNEMFLCQCLLDPKKPSNDEVQDAVISNLKDIT